MIRKRYTINEAVSEALKIGHKELSRLLILKEQISSLEPPTFENTLRAHELFVKLLNEHTRFLKKISDPSPAESDNATTFYNHVLTRIVLSSLTTPAELPPNIPADEQGWAAMKASCSILESELTAFASLLDKLVAAKANIVQIFATLRGVGIQMQWYWKHWEETYEPLRRKAISYKKAFHSLRNAMATILPPECNQLAFENLKDRCALMDHIAHPESFDEMKQKYGSNGNSERRNSKVWTPVLSNLERQLIPYIKPSKTWNDAGGTIGRHAIASDVYKVINALLHFSYPNIWPLNDRTTASIKARCHQYRDGR
jgi:hypothetical protein